jgi:biopolymer transport protein ExbB
MKTKLTLIIFCLILMTRLVGAQTAARDNAAFDGAAKTVQEQLRESVAELNKLREQVANEKIPLSRKLSELEGELSKTRQEYQQTVRLLDGRSLDLNTLDAEIKSRREEAAYIANLLGEYIRNFESRLHITELQRHRESLDKAKLALENTTLSENEVYEAQVELLMVSLERLRDSLGGSRFEGSAVDAQGMVRAGTFVKLGPVAIFRSKDGEIVGVAEQRLGSLEPTVVPFNNPLDIAAAAELVSEGSGFLPLDPSLGNAHKIEQTRESLIEHIKKGGPVMYPIFVLAGAALLVALFKWLSMAFIRTPSEGRIRRLLASIAQHDTSDALRKAKKIGGPVGEMLSAGINHIAEPRDLIEEVMYEKVLATRLRLQRFLSFISISAASAPLLGLLGTVTGMINTFKLITVFGSGDVKTLSSGISEALITTEYGLIVAIPSLLLHAFLSRKARGVVDQMEKAAVALMNQVAKTPFTTSDYDEDGDISPTNGKDASRRDRLKDGHQTGLSGGDSHQNPPVVANPEQRLAT